MPTYRIPVRVLAEGYVAVTAEDPGLAIEWFRSAKWAAGCEDIEDLDLVEISVAGEPEEEE